MLLQPHPHNRFRSPLRILPDPQFWRLPAIRRLCHCIVSSDITIVDISVEPWSRPLAIPIADIGPGLSLIETANLIQAGLERGYRELTTLQNFRARPGISFFRPEWMRQPALPIPAVTSDTRETYLSRWLLELSISGMRVVRAGDTPVGISDVGQMHLPELVG